MVLPSAICEAGLRLDGTDLNAAHGFTKIARNFKKLLWIVVEAGCLNDRLSEFDRTLSFKDT
jgi:hypothetical protein